MSRLVVLVLLAAAAACSVESFGLLAIDEGARAPAPPVNAADAEGGAVGANPIEDASAEGDAAGLDAAQPPSPDAPTGAPPVPCLTGNAGVALCFHFEGAVDDESTPRNFPSTLGTVSFVPGRVGQALQLSEASDITIPYHATFDLSAFTVQAWIRPMSLPATGRMGIFDSNGRFGLFLLPSGAVQCLVGVNLETTAIPAGAWTHVACVHDGVRLSLYRDGSLATSRAAPELATNSEPVAIGRNLPSGDHFYGELDELEVWSVPRSAGEIRAAAGRVP